jgi:hypothetical protein
MDGEVMGFSGRKVKGTRYKGQGRGTRQREGLTAISGFGVRVSGYGFRVGSRETGTEQNTLTLALSLRERGQEGRRTSGGVVKLCDLSKL